MSPVIFTMKEVPWAAEADDEGILMRLEGEANNKGAELVGRVGAELVDGVGAELVSRVGAELVSGVGAELVSRVGADVVLSVVRILFSMSCTFMSSMSWKHASSHNCHSTSDR